MQPTTKDRRLPHTDTSLLPQPEKLRCPPPHLGNWTYWREANNHDRQGRSANNEEGQGRQRRQWTQESHKWKALCYCPKHGEVISFSWGQFRFVDSYAFLSSSLDRLVGNTPKENLSITRLRFSTSQFNLVTRKGVYPYEYMTDFERFEERQLPSQVGNQVPVDISLHLFGLLEGAPKLNSSKLVSFVYVYRTGQVLQQSQWRVNFGWGLVLSTCSGCVGDFQLSDNRWLPRSLSPNGRPPSSRCVWEFSQRRHEHLRSWPGSLLYATWVLLGLPPQVHQCLSRTFHRTRHVPLRRERSPRRDLNGQSVSRCRQQPVHAILQPWTTDLLPHVLRCQQPLRMAMGHESANANRRLPVGK